MANKNIDIILQAKDLASKQINTVKSSILWLKNSSEQVKQAWDNLSRGWAIAFAWLTLAAKNVTDASNEMQASMIWLQSIVEWTWNDFWKAKEFIKEFTKDWLISTWETATSLKNLLSRWFWLEEASVLMNRFKDSASFGRQASLKLWEAVKSATEWIKNENSILVDNAWVTKNVSKMWEDYANQLWKSTTELTLAEKRQAEYNWIIQETKFQIWDAEKLTKTFAWTQAVLWAETIKLKVQIWEALTPVINQLYSAIIPVLKTTTEWISKNPELAKTITIVAIWVTGLITWLAWLWLILWPITSALVLLKAWFFLLTPAIWTVATATSFLVATPLWLLLVAITWLIAVITAWIVNWKELSQTIWIIIILIQRNIVDWFNYIKENVLLIWLAIRDWFLWFIEWLYNWLVEKVDKALNYVKEKVAQAKSLMSNIWWRIKTGVTNVWTNVKNFLWLNWARASWWPVSSWWNYLVWEKWPELFVPRSSWTIIPNWWVGGITINMWWVVVNNEADETRLVEKIKRELTNSLQMSKFGIS